jgi:hypothetical protein
MRLSLVSALALTAMLALGACGGGEGGSGADADPSCAGCIDENGDCVAGATDTACGSGGLACDDCVAQGASCVGQVCELPCGPDTCSGCCDGTTCVMGTSDTACGGGGQRCQSCAGDICSFGECVSASCSTTCGGCCSGDTCLGGDSSAACGMAGGACLDCGPSRLCDGGGCVVAPTSRWQVVVLSGTVPQFNDDGDPWDPFGGLPDPYVRVTAGGILEPEISGDTDSVSNTLTPYWNDIAVEDVPARSLFDYFNLAVFDADVGFDDLIGTCSFPLANDSSWFDGSTIVVSCGAATVRFRIRPQ